MVIDPEQWCYDLIKELEIDNTVESARGVYSADGTLLHCELVINDDTVPFFVEFGISNEGYVLSSLVQPYLLRDYLKYGSRGYVSQKNKWREYTPRDVKYYCISYLAQNLDLKPSIEDFGDRIMEMRNFWLSDGPIPQLEYIPQSKQILYLK